ncbi:MAG: GYD domain-containing protein [Dehalococcoidia bacterium]|nr:MAG: GYD domain-containing protein [Dehalococcoidia bacterium]
MAVFVALGTATDEGIRNLEAMSLRHKKAVERAEERGVKVLASYALLGQYDYLVILEAPDAKTVAYVLTKEAQGGNVRYQTLAALPMDEFTETVQD